MEINIAVTKPVVSKVNSSTKPSVLKVKSESKSETKKVMKITIKTKSNTTSNVV